MAIYYMRDNHTFKKLGDNALAEIEAEFDAGHTHGMLCTHDTTMRPLNAHGNKQDFLRKADEWLKAYAVFTLGAGI